MGAIFKVAGVFGVALLLAGKLMKRYSGQKVTVAKWDWFRWYSYPGPITTRSNSRVSRHLGCLLHTKTDVV
jgi:hypothetical protein